MADQATYRFSNQSFDRPDRGYSIRQHGAWLGWNLR
jgi:hypothetical protein